MWVICTFALSNILSPASACYFKLHPTALLIFLLLTSLSNLTLWWQKSVVFSHFFWLHNNVIISHFFWLHKFVAQQYKGQVRSNTRQKQFGLLDTSLHDWSPGIFPDPTFVDRRDSLPSLVKGIHAEAASFAENSLFNFAVVPFCQSAGQKTSSPYLYDVQESHAMKGSLYQTERTWS